MYPVPFIYPVSFAYIFRLRVTILVAELRVRDREQMCLYVDAFRMSAGSLKFLFVSVKDKTKSETNFKNLFIHKLETRKSICHQLTFSRGSKS